MIRPSTKMFCIAVALWAVATISYVNTTFGFVSSDLGATTLQVSFILLGVVAATFGLIFLCAEKHVPSYRKFRLSALFAHMRLNLR